MELSLSTPSNNSSTRPVARVARTTRIEEQEGANGLVDADELLDELE